MLMPQYSFDLRPCLSSGMLLQAPRFSKYLHGVAALFPERVSKMPYWFLHNTDGSMTSATWEEMSDDKDTYYEEVSNLF